VKKYVLSFLFLLFAATVMGQKKSIVNLIQSERSEAVKGANGKTIIKVHRGVFKQDYSTLTSDSAYFYQDLNMVDAFGHVVINQGDTLHIYSDKLNYNGNTKIAILTDNVKMVDRDATLTTNYLTYNTATRIAIYTGGGKLVNKDNTLISKNGYYFSFTRDAYFRYNVVCTTPDAVIKTDTLRYNTGSRITYFYGPTNIVGKDKNNLYTENGTYNTITEQAFFGKKNLYTEGTKTLKGDSLFYDRLKGYGRAVKHVTFNDNEQKATIKGDLGEYYKADGRAVVTQNPYMIFVTVDKDSTQTDPAAKKLPQIKTDSLSKKLPGQIKQADLKKGRLKADSLAKQLPDQPKIDLDLKKVPLHIKADSANKKLLGQIPDVKTITTLGKKLNTTAKGTPINKQAIKDTIPGKTGIEEQTGAKADSLFLGADTLETQIITYKELKELQRKNAAVNSQDTSIKVKPVVHIVYTKSPKFLTLDAPKLGLDSGFLHRDIFGAPKPPHIVVVKKKPLTIADQKKIEEDSIKTKLKTDSLDLIANHGLRDTSRIRIITGHHHAKIFKSDLQAKADSMFYSYSDSTIRCYVKPIIWTQGSQLSGDTIYLQLKNKKIDNMDMFPSAFIVNIDKADSIHFNQIGGKKMHGTFKNGKLSGMLVTGNAETIYFQRDSVRNKVTNMERSVSGRLRVRMKNGAVSRTTLFDDPETYYTPIGQVKDEDKTLKGLNWKPKERPESKEAIISGNKKLVVMKPPSSSKGTAAKSSTVKPPSKKATGVKAGIDSTAKTTKTINSPVIKSAKDTSVIKPGPINNPAIKAKDSVIRK
jgi:lipopolysaccharide export system protein LptA